MSGHFPCERENHPGKPHGKRLAEGLAEEEQAEFLQLAAKGSECFGIEMVEDQISDAGIRAGIIQCLEKVSPDPMDAGWESLGARTEIEPCNDGLREDAVQTLQEVTPARAQLLKRADFHGMLPKHGPDPSFVPEEGIDEPKIQPAPDGSGVGGIHRVEQLGNKESLFHGI
jgi:hypothetical protein